MNALKLIAECEEDLLTGGPEGLADVVESIDAAEPLPGLPLQVAATLGDRDLVTDGVQHWIRGPEGGSFPLDGEEWAGINTSQQVHDFWLADADATPLSEWLEFSAEYEPDEIASILLGEAALQAGFVGEENETCDLLTARVRIAAALAAVDAASEAWLNAAPSTEAEDEAEIAQEAARAALLSDVRALCALLPGVRS